MKTTMYCPYCHKELIGGELKEFETLCEHVSDPNQESFPLRETFVCNNDECPCSKEDLFWDSEGAMYGWNRNFKFKDDINSAYPSFERKCDIEIYKKGLKKEIYLSPILMLGLLKPVIEFNYKADEYGNVLSKSWCLKWLRMSRKLFEYNTYYIFPYVMIKFHLNHVHDLIKMYKSNPDSEYFKSELKHQFEPLPSWDKRWWRHFELWFSKIIFRKYYKTYLNK
jgi:hypothetical protein